MGFSSDELQLESWKKQMNVLRLALLLSFGVRPCTPDFVPQNLQTEPIQACYITDMTIKQISAVTFALIRLFANSSLALPSISPHLWPSQETNL